MTDANTAAENTAEQTETEAAPITLGPNDLSLYANIMKVSMERGTFKAEEYTQVGTAYDKLTAFLKQITPPAEATDADTEEGSESPAAATESDATTETA